MTNNLVIFKRWYEVKDEKFYIIGVYWKIRFLGGVTKKQYIGGEFPKKGAWAVCRFKGGGGLAEKGGWGFFGGGWYPNAHYERPPSWKS